MTFAVLCSHAIYRDGLFSILEAGLESFTVDGYPSLIAPTLAVKLDFVPADFGEASTLRVTVEHEDGERLSEVGFAITYNPPITEPSALTYFTALIHSLPLQLRRDGTYQVNISLNAETERPIRFQAMSRLPAV